MNRRSDMLNEGRATLIIPSFMPMMPPNILQLQTTEFSISNSVDTPIHLAMPGETECKNAPFNLQSSHATATITTTMKSGYRIESVPNQWDSVSVQRSSDRRQPQSPAEASRKTGSASVSVSVSEEKEDVYESHRHRWNYAASPPSQIKKLCLCFLNNNRKEIVTLISWNAPHLMVLLQTRHRLVCFCRCRFCDENALDLAINLRGAPTSPSAHTTVQG